ncbi:MAG: M23 family metallopeptidase, partial [Anaerolineae bacterium]
QAEHPTPTELPPLQFVFPEEVPPPVSAWRPPLYPVPWEPSPVEHFYFARPIAADEVNWPLANYRYGGVFFGDQVHTGVDIPAPPGTPVIAAQAGRVIWAGWGLYRGVPGDTTDPYGLAVVIQHEFGFQGRRLFSVYAHMSEITVPRGQWVELGEEIGRVGDTGFVTGPHLHMEIRWGEVGFFHTLNPELWMAPPEGWGVLAARVMSTAGELLPRHTLTITSILTGQRWQGITYGAGGAVNPDPYFRENLVIGDLPAGRYEITTIYASKEYTQEFEIAPGRVTYVSFRGRQGFSLQPPPLPGASFSPLDN